MSSYFTLPSFARAKKHKEELEATNPQKPILNDEDERFLEKQISKGEEAESVTKAAPSKISDDGKENDATVEEQQKAGAGAEQVAIPETQPEPQDGSADTKEVVSDETAVPSSPKKSKKKKDFDLPSQEDAEKATQGWDTYMASQKSAQPGTPSGEKRTWASYLPSLKPGTKKDESVEQKDSPQQSTAEDAKDASGGDSTGQRTWAQYASAYVPTSMPSLPQSLFKSKDKDANVEPVYNEDGTVNEAKTAEKQEKEVSVLLDNLNMSSINNRVFAFSGETQKIYDRFAQVLKDTMNGAPTAYDDMDKLMREAGPQLEKQFKSMPPFVQTLVKSLPAKLGTTLGPEILAASSEKPGNDLKVKLDAAGKKAGSGATTPTGKGPAKKKQKVPGLKGLISSEGAIAGMLRNVVTFLRVRFPFLASGTNVVMSLAVFILMFSFWYCHKRGKEARLAKDAEAEQAGEGSEAEDDTSAEEEEADGVEGKDEEGGDPEDEKDIEKDDLSGDVAQVTSAEPKSS